MPSHTKKKIRASKKRNKKATRIGARPTQNVGATLNEILMNAFTTRADFFRTIFDPRRDLNKEAGYPDVISKRQYKEMYDREGISTRIVEIWPEESWKVIPEVLENEDPEDSEFEKAVKDFNDSMHLWHFLNKADIVSGIGHYGILLLGIDDGKELNQPIDGLDEQGNAEGNTHKIIYLRAFDETQTRIDRLDTDQKSPRFGKPILYNLDFVLERGANTQEQISASGNLKTFNVHWHRVIHIADNCRGSTVFGVPRLQDTFNRMLDLRKLLGGSAEMFWKGAFPGYSFEVDPTIQGVELDKESLRKEFDAYQNGLQRYLSTVGVSVKSLSPQVAEPDKHFETQMKAVSVSVGVPMRILMGSEQAKLASTQDIRTWNGRLRKRQNDYLTPLVIRPTIDRLIAIGQLPPPATDDGYMVVWPDLNALTDEDRALIAKSQTESLAKYVGAGVSTLIAPMEYLTIILGLSVDEAESIIEAANEQQSTIDEEELEAEAIAAAALAEQEGNIAATA